MKHNWRILLDQNIRNEVTLNLKKKGVDTIHASEVGLQTSPDPEILSYAIQEDRVLITRDTDFGDLKIFALPTVFPGVIRIKVNAPFPSLITDILINFFELYPPEYIQNSLVILTQNKVRIRRSISTE